jgi:hypothetical protein
MMMEQRAFARFKWSGILKNRLMFPRGQGKVILVTYAVLDMMGWFPKSNIDLNDPDFERYYDNDMFCFHHID